MREDRGFACPKPRFPATAFASRCSRTPIPPPPAALAERGYSVDVIPRALEGDELARGDGGVARARRAIAHQGARGAPRHAGRMLAIGCLSVGTDQVAIADAARRGIPVFNAPHASTRSVAELALGNIVALARRLGDKNAGLHERQVGQVAGRRPRGAWTHGRHHRLRPHRPAGRAAGRGLRHARALSRHREGSCRSASRGRSPTSTPCSSRRISSRSTCPKRRARWR